MSLLGKCRVTELNPQTLRTQDSYAIGPLADFDIGYLPPPGLVSVPYTQEVKPVSQEILT